MDNFDYFTVRENLIGMVLHGRDVMAVLANHDKLPMAAIQYFSFQMWKVIIEEPEKRLFRTFVVDNPRYDDLDRLFAHLPADRADIPISLRQTYDNCEVDKEFCKLLRAVTAFLEF